MKAERNHEKDCLTISSHGWRLGKLKTGQKCILFSHALEFILVSVQDNHLLEGEPQGDCEITFLFLDQEQQHCDGIRQSLKKHLKETDYKEHEIHWLPLYLPPCYLQGQCKKRHLSSMGDVFSNKRTRLSLDNSGK